MSNMYFALGDAAGEATGSFLGSGIGLVLYIVALVAFIYFLFIKPQKKEQKRVTAMINDMEVGDTVLTTSGFYGILIDVTDDTVIVEFGNNKNCRIPMEKTAIKQVEKASEN